MKIPAYSHIAGCAVASLAPIASAQEAMYTAAATMPSPGVVVLRPQLNFSRFGFNPNNGTEHTDRQSFDTSIQVGLVRALALTFDVPVEFEKARDAATGETDRDRGVSDLSLTFKYRFFQEDSGGINTIRAALLAGAHFASGDDHDFSTESVNPHLGAVLTVVRERHGFDFEVDYRLNTGGSDRDNLSGGEGASDAFTYNAAYLFRPAPGRYTSTTTGSWYATIELNGIYETNGDNEIRWSPGFMYEGRSFAIEIMAQLPLVNHLDHRPELDFSFGIGVRWTF